MTRWPGGIAQRTWPDRKDCPSHWNPSRKPQAGEHRFHCPETLGAENVAAFVAGAVDADAVVAEAASAVVVVVGAVVADDVLVTFAAALVAAVVVVVPAGDAQLCSPEARPVSARSGQVRCRPAKRV